MYRISVPYAQKDPRFLFEKRRGQPWEFWSLVSTIDGSTLPQDCLEEQQLAEHKVTGKTCNLKKKKKKKWNEYSTPHLKAKRGPVCHMSILRNSN